MKNQLIYIWALLLLAAVFTGCGSKSADTEGKQENHTEGQGSQGEEEMGTVHLSTLKFNSLNMKVDSLPTRALTGTVEANGQLEVPPQYEATVTAILGANVTSIKVIEGDKVKRGQVDQHNEKPL